MLDNKYMVYTDEQVKEEIDLLESNIRLDKQKLEKLENEREFRKI